MTINHIHTTILSTHIKTLNYSALCILHSLYCSWKTIDFSNIEFVHLSGAAVMEHFLEVIAP